MLAPVDSHCGLHTMEPFNQALQQLFRTLRPDLYRNKDEDARGFLQKSCKSENSMMLRLHAISSEGASCATTLIADVKERCQNP